ncbi:MAG: restriction endonuclease subunit S [Pseudomonadota bacterium]|nr:restriction endonuclease subunit S [Pseudomonadota bacterium]
MTWPTRRIDDIAIFLNARRVPVKAADRAKRQGAYPYYGASGIVDWVDGFIFDGEYLLISEDGENLRSRNTPIAYLARGKYWVNNHAHILDEREPGILRYLSWALNRTDLSPYITGAAQPKLNKRTLAEMEIAIPPEAERLKINALLGALDDKIELNRRMSATLEEMARALYRSWFVDFEPVHARALGQSPAHMDATTAALFPDSFGPDGLPKGWPRQPLAQHVKAARGLSYKGKHLCGQGDGVPLHNLNSIYEGGGYKDDGAKYYDGDYKPRHEIRPGDLIVANTEQSFGLELIGHAALVPSWLGSSGIFSQHLYKVEIKSGSPLSKEWLYLALSIAPLGVEIRGFSNGTTVNMLPADAFEIPETAIPPGAIVERMNEFVRPAFAKQERLREEARTLAALRDTLLPRLMSGELRIREAEKQVEEVL